jgi:hypothetical protein
MYLWTAAIAYPVMVWAFAPLWIAVLVGFTFGSASILIMNRDKTKSEKSGEQIAV